VVVDRARLDVELGPEATHGEGGQPVGVEQVDGVGEHVTAVVSHTPSRWLDCIDGVSPSP
jgi:hypothetical protein